MEQSLNEASNEAILKMFPREDSNKSAVFVSFTATYSVLTALILGNILEAVMLFLFYC